MERWALIVTLMLQAAGVARPPVITGQVQMSDGSPAGAVRVAAVNAPGPNIRPSDGQNYYQSVAPAGTTLTNDAGRFEFTNLAPGRYFIVAGVTGQGTFYPSTLDIDAATVITVVAGGPVVEGINFKVLTSPGSRVRGSVTPGPTAGVRELAVLSGTYLGQLVEAPVREDGSFEFGRVPRGSYVLSVYPEPPGMPLQQFVVGDQDVTGLKLTRPPTRTVSGRIVVENGPLPRSFLAFFTDQSYVGAVINADGTFTTRLHNARHGISLGGLPVGYALSSVRMGTQEVMTQGLQVSNADVTGVVLTVRTPRQLPRLTGRLAPSVGAPAGARVLLNGPVLTNVETTTRGDGSFEFAALPPGLYRLSLPQVPTFATRNIVVDSTGANVQIQ